MEKIINIDTGRQLFVDDALVSSTTLKRVWHHPVKFEGNPVMTPELPWEVNEGGNAAAIPKGGGIWWDEDRRVFRLWYEGGWLHTVCYAESKDGIHWERPPVGIYPGTNIVLPTDNPVFRPDSWSVVKDPHATDPSQRFKLMLHRPWAEPWAAQEGVCCVSADGLRWRRLHWLPPSGDRSSLYYDPFRERWVYSIRSNWKNPGEQTGRRNRMRYETDDFTKPPAWYWRGDDFSLPHWLQADDRDLAATPVAYPASCPKPQLYCFDAVAYESVMLGLFEIHLGPENDVCERAGLPKMTDIRFGFSRDGTDFQRGDFSPAIAPEGWGSGKWDTGYVQPVANGCVVVGDELWFYYGAFRGAPERGNDAGKKREWWIDNGMYANASMGLAKLRRDGFASLEGTGEVLTRPLAFSGEFLFVNVDASRGSFAAELVDKDGNVVEGYAAEDSRIERVDSTKCRVVWKTRDRLNVRKWDSHRLRFRLENAALYAFWVSLEEGGASNGWLAGGGPGYAGLRDEPRTRRADIPPVFTAPDAAHAKATRKYEGIPSIAASPDGRTLWATWYASRTEWEDETNYVVLAKSEDGGATWREVLVCDPDGDGPRRAFDPELWLAPDGLLRWTWADKVGPVGAWSGDDQLWMAALDPATGAFVEPPRKIACGVMMNKPTVLRDGTWLLPVALWRDHRSAGCWASTDGGRTFSFRGGVTLPQERRCYDEHTILEKRDGSLKCYIRMNNGRDNCLWSAESRDGGFTWTAPKAEPLANLDTRAFFTKLRNGDWLCVKNGGYGKILRERADLTAFVSRDDGETWEGGLSIDRRTGCSYPDGCQLPDGSILVISDFDRKNLREVSFARFTEDDVLGYAADPPRAIVSRADFVLLA